MATITIGRKLNYSTDSVTTAQGLSGSQAWLTAEQNQLVPMPYDYIDLTYHPTKIDLITVAVYKVGGVDGAVVATLTIAYDDNDNVASVTRS